MDQVLPWSSCYAAFKKKNKYILSFNVQRQVAHEFDPEELKSSVLCKKEKDIKDQFYCLKLIKEERGRGGGNSVKRVLELA